MTTTGRSPRLRDSGPVMNATGMRTSGPRLARKLIDAVCTSKKSQAEGTTTENEIQTAFCTADMVENDASAHQRAALTRWSPPSSGSGGGAVQQRWP